MKSFTDIFIRRPVLASVVSLLILLIGYGLVVLVGRVDGLADLVGSAFGEIE